MTETTHTIPQITTDERKRIMPLDLAKTRAEADFWKAECKALQDRINAIFTQAQAGEEVDLVYEDGSVIRLHTKQVVSLAEPAPEKPVLDEPQNEAVIELKQKKMA